MNAKLVLSVLCLIVLSMLPGCAQQPAVIPVTGKIASDAQIVKSLHTGEMVLDFINLESDMLSAHSDIPTLDTWVLTIKPDTRAGVPPQFRYTSGDWIMLIRETEAGSGKFVVAVTNSIENFHWCGYRKADGTIFNASQMRAGR